MSNAAFLGALIMVHALTRLELGAAAARRTVLFGAFFPTAFFLLAPYTEPLFLLLSIAAFWFARRNRWIWAMVAGAGAAATRSIGALLIVALAVEALVQWRHGRLLLPRLGAALGVALGPLAYLAYWQVRFGDFWAPLDAQRNWRREATFPLTALWHAVKLTWLYQTWWLIDVIVVGIDHRRHPGRRLPRSAHLHGVRGDERADPADLHVRAATADLDAEVHGGRLPCVVGVRHRRGAPASPRDCLPGRLRGRLLAARLPVHQLAARLLGRGLLVFP